jgi:hypothetical protein
MKAFNNDFFSYSTNFNPFTQQTTGTLQPVTTDPALTPPARLLKENGKKLYPGAANPGVNTYMVGVYDPVSFLSGYIDPNSYTFTLANTDKPYDVIQATAGTLGTNPNSGATYLNDLAPPILTNGDIIAKGMISTIGGITTNSNIFALGNIQAASYIATNSYLSSGTALFVGTSLTAQQNIQNLGFVSTSRLFVNATGGTGFATTGTVDASTGIHTNPFTRITVTNVACSATSKIFVTRGFNCTGTIGSAISVENLGTNTFTIVTQSGVNPETTTNTFNWFVVN